MLAYVPKGNWIFPNTNIAVANIEGLLVTPVTIPTVDVINSCASDPSPTFSQTVCTANNNQVYVIKLDSFNVPQVTNKVSSDGKGTISFSGGSCTNCGIAMDAVHHKAVIGLSLNTMPVGKPGFQFLDLSNTASDPIFETAFVSPAKQISEDPLIDPSKQHHVHEWCDRHTVVRL